MTAGVPGTGIGGLFYLLAALLLPLRGLALKARGVSVAWPTILRQLRLAIGVFLGLWAMGWLIGFILGPAGTSQAAERSGISATPQFQSALRWAALLAGMATLLLVLLVVQFARLVTRRPAA
jgi:hypothetical protein